MSYVQISSNFIKSLKSWRGPQTNDWRMDKSRTPKEPFCSDPTTLVDSCHEHPSLSNNKLSFRFRGDKMHKKKWCWHAKYFIQHQPNQLIKKVPEKRNSSNHHQHVFGPRWRWIVVPWHRHHHHHPPKPPPWTAWTRSRWAVRVFSWPPHERLKPPNFHKGWRWSSWCTMVSTWSLLRTVKHFFQVTPPNKNLRKYRRLLDEINHLFRWDLLSHESWIISSSHHLY